MVLALSLLGQVLSFLPEPIGSNAQAFSDGARTTLWLTLVSGAVGLVLGTVAALACTARWVAVRWVASFYIWAIRGNCRCWCRSCSCTLPCRCWCRA